MTQKAFRVEDFKDFLSKSDEYIGDKLYDTKTRIATCYGYNRKKYEYELKENDDLNILLKRGYVKGYDIEIYEPF